MKNLYKYFSFLAIALTLSACSAESSNDMAGSPSQPGQGGSLARFTIANNHLFAVNDGSLRVFHLQDKTDPIYITKVDLNRDVETIFARDSATLFIGTTSGMLIYDISDAPNVRELSTYEHIVSCDPVVANQNYAYVTLRSDDANMCNRNVNRLEVVDISDLRNPRLVSERNMISPRGLGLHGDTLLVCDKGIKVFDVSNPLNLQYLTADEDVDAVDIIPFGKLMIIRSETGLAQYEFNNSSLKLLSEL